MTLPPHTSRYRQIADILQSEIADGTYAPGSTLPTEEQLAKRFGVSRPTINQAGNVLRRLGLIRVERSVGMIVRDARVIHSDRLARFMRDRREEGTNRGAFDADVRHAGMEPRSDVQVSRGPAPDEVCEALGIEPGAQCITRTRQMFADAQPVQLAVSYVAASIADGTPIAETDTGPGGTFSRLADLGLPVTTLSESVSARMAAPDEASFLDVESDQPVLEIFRVASSGDQPVEVTLHVIPASGWRLIYKWTAS